MPALPLWQLLIFSKYKAPMERKAIHFGYSVTRDRQIDFDANNHDICKIVAAAEPTLNLCISCGTCAATCTASLFTDFSLRQVILLLRRGETKGLGKEISKCMLCGKCQLVCPRNVSTRNLIIQISKALVDSKLLDLHVVNRK
jgi:heterodisulfide reductase subunit C